MGIFVGLSALLVLTPYSQADASGCCSATGLGTKEVQIQCPNGVQGKVRLSGKNEAESAALLRFPAVFEAHEDAGTYFQPDREVAVVRGKLDGASIILSTFASNGTINFLLSNEVRGKVYVTSSLGGTEPTCEQADASVAISESDLPTGLSLADVSGESSSPDRVYSALFGS